MTETTGHRASASSILRLFNHFEHPQHDQRIITVEIGREHGPVPLARPDPVGRICDPLPIDSSRDSSLQVAELLLRQFTVSQSPLSL